MVEKSLQLLCVLSFIYEGELHRLELAVLFFQILASVHNANTLGHLGAMENF